ncbi:hypothetical protein E2C01_020446 [Portunus trituberculatus]|uniref:Uncharacterized protein n=1 Tax=Portunus trituberculatus TaxID=210409 RepID=A0A5B7E0H1_PORTR|nr:hypothetical protein [Portunus trituberculatus]
MLAMVLTMGAAQASEKKDEGRFIITSANGNDDMINVTVGLNSIVMMSLALIGVVLRSRDRPRQELRSPQLHREQRRQVPIRGHHPFSLLTSLLPPPPPPQPPQLLPLSIPIMTH